MFYKQTTGIFRMLWLIAALVLSGCSTLSQAVAPGPTAPVMEVTAVQVEAQTRAAYDQEGFKDALLKAIARGDRESLQMWMTEPFLTGTWRADLSDTPAVDALEELFASEMSANPTLEVVSDVDLKVLLGGSDPLAIPRAEAGVVEAVLVSGWGATGMDEAVLFLARQPDGGLRWHGWMRINGGVSGARFGGVKVYQNDALGFRVYVPRDYAVNEVSEQDVSLVGPAVQGAGHPGNASIHVEPANGRTAEEAAQQVYRESKELMGAYGNVSITALGMDVTTAYVVVGVPGQDMQRQLFMVHDDRLYRMWFLPDNPQEQVSYQQMENLYAMITNTFVFTR